MNNSLYNFHFQNDFLYHEEKKQQHMGEIIYTLLDVLKIHCMEITSLYLKYIISETNKRIVILKINHKNPITSSTLQQFIDIFPQPRFHC
jgi:hypothetical protein